MIIAQLGGISQKLRNYFLKRYLARCKLVNSLAFFQWRAKREERNPDVAMLRQVFSDKVDFMIRTLESSIATRKQMLEEAKATMDEQKKLKKNILSLAASSLTNQKTIKMADLEMREQTVDKRVFCATNIDKSHYIDAFDMIGWTDPSQPNPQKTLKWLRSLDFDTLVYPVEVMN